MSHTYRKLWFPSTKPAFPLVVQLRKCNSTLLDAQAKNHDAIPDSTNKFYLSCLRNFQNLTTSYHPHVDAYLSTTSGSQTCLWLSLHQLLRQVLSFPKLWWSGAPPPSCIVTRRNVADPAPPSPSVRKAIRVKLLPPPHLWNIKPSFSPLGKLQPAHLRGFQPQSTGSPCVSQANFPQHKNTWKNMSWLSPPHHQLKHSLIGFFLGI